LRRSNQGQVFKKRSEAVCLNAFILLLALPRNNDVDVVKLKKCSHQKQFSPPSEALAPHDTLPHVSPEVNKQPKGNKIYYAHVVVF